MLHVDMGAKVNHEILIFACVRLNLVLVGLSLLVIFLPDCGNEMHKLWLLIHQTSLLSSLDDLVVGTFVGHRVDFILDVLAFGLLSS